MVKYLIRFSEIPADGDGYQHLHSRGRGRVVSLWGSDGGIYVCMYGCHQNRARTAAGGSSGERN